jgi:riboflavin biosynthesis pyrimidine reductase
MSDDGDGTQFTLLSGTGEVAPDALSRRYAYPEDLPSCWVRGNMIASIDGGATAGGKSGHLGGVGDRAVFAALRGLADVIVVGAETARVEDYSGVHLDAAERRARRDRGQGEIPPIAVLTRSGRLDHDAKLFQRSEIAPIVLTSADEVDGTRRRLGSLAEVVGASGAESDSVDLRTVLALLAERELMRVLTEGGPGILGQFIAGDLLDELCVTVSPVVVGGAAGRIATGPGEVRSDMSLLHALSDGAGYLYLRYARDRGAER